MLATTLLDTKPFLIEFQGKTWGVTIEIVGIDPIYLVKYPSGTVYLALVRAKGLNEPTFWATIPENSKRHDEAQVVGRLIFDYYQSIK